MAKDWEYAKAAKWIAEHGGTQKAFETVKNYYTKKGFAEGAASRKPAIALASAGGLVVGFVGKCIYDKIIKKKSFEMNTAAVERVKVKEAETELITTMKEAAQAEIETIGETEENGPEAKIEST